MKYKYAVLAFEGALKIFSVSDDDEYGSLLSVVAKCAHTENDLRRAIDMYSEIFNRYKNREKNRMNEIIYVSEILCSMYMDIGDFDSAKQYLITALKYFPSQDSEANSASSSSGRPQKRKTYDPTYFKLKIMLAQVFLSSYQFELGLKQLETLMNQNPPCGKSESDN